MQRFAGCIVFERKEFGHGADAFGCIRKRFRAFGGEYQRGEQVYCRYGDFDTVSVTRECEFVSAVDSQAVQFVGGKAGGQCERYGSLCRCGAGIDLIPTQVGRCSVVYEIDNQRIGGAGTFVVAFFQFSDYASGGFSGREVALYVIRNQVSRVGVVEVCPVSGGEPVPLGDTFEHLCRVIDCMERYGVVNPATPSTTCAAG